MEIVHKPVLLEEVLEQLNPQPGQKFIDGTINGGGHGGRIAERVMPGGQLLGIEWDPALYRALQLRISNSEFPSNVVLVNDSYANLQKLAQANDFLEADGVLLDLGFSSWHMAESGKGFTFQKDEILDMRYHSVDREKRLVDGGEPVTAAEIINNYPKEEIEKILREYGEEKFARQIAEAVVAARQVQPIIRTFQLVEVIRQAVPQWYRLGRRLNPATKTFQALRMAVNQELENVESGLRQAIPVLRVGGRIAVLTFHSLEDRIVKNFFRTEAQSKHLKIITKKPIRAEYEAVKANPRARSASLRVAEKI